MDNLRNTALNMLLKTLEEGEFSHRVLNAVFTDLQLSAKERSFLNRLYAGTLERLVELDYLLNRVSSIPVRKMKPVIRNLLRMSVYQLRYMDSVPAHACINEAVQLTRKRGFQNLTGFVNGVLRRISREEEDPSKWPDNVKAGVPAWIFQLVKKQYGSRTDAFFRAVREEQPETFLWLNQRKAEPDTILKSLESDGCRVHKLSAPDHAFAIQGFESLTGLKAFQEGQIMIQDVSSMRAAECVIRHTQDPNLILDVCAAPGGKSLYVANHLPKTRIIARDLTEQKVERIRENCARLGFSNVVPQVHDALQMDPSMENAADALIADLPCSGLGVIGHKPDLLYRLKEPDLSSLQTLQRQILDTVKSYVKPGGILVYSTCTINQGENEENARWFQEQSGFSLLEERCFLPGQDPGDGFYLACFQKPQQP